MQFEEFASLAEEIKAGYISASLTDEFILDTWPMSACTLEDKENKILEIRIFNKEQELKIFRSDVFQDNYKVRMIRVCDEKDMEKDRDFFDQNQYLDIDTKRSTSSFKENGMVYATGGGKYHLPIPSMKDAVVRIRYYYAQSPAGQARIKDWRLVDLVSCGEGGADSGI